MFLSYFFGLLLSLLNGPWYLRPHRLNWCRRWWQAKGVLAKAFAWLAIQDTWVAKSSGAVEGVDVQPLPVSV